ncbi:hypothetical protein DSCA_62350 [Desulfosarcina alkanivorans]|uniref:4Fe-4S ferredoxin-type domain-containing protein n=1 Tax=Desulfosarcina alkanivorans TaxID=571177 RepID=A0A5K7YV69_9BACT|nr:FAD-dependent oxidoreductase [Desulfosarcina alkanivorans]BBO72305.1 hypothetical protein DSCA_62350 [Desulfosarcina alkanivorans]
MEMHSRTGDTADPVLVVGGGVAGISAALDLARAGRDVHLVEKGGEPGGRTARLDKLYPTDHCGFCPVWSEVRLCRQHLRVTVHTRTTVRYLEPGDGFQTAVLCRTPNPIDPSLCIYCGRCAGLCGEKAVVPTAPHVCPPAFRIDSSVCTRCGQCVEACPTGAVDFERKPVDIRVRVQGVIWATGFEPADLLPAKEFGYGSHPDIMEALAFEDWIAEAGPNRGRARCHDGRPARQVAFIQCAGARDRRLQPQCNAVCCMHALKQARWVRRRNPDCRCVIFYADMRTEGHDYESYYRNGALAAGIEMVRARPGMVCPLPDGDGIAVRYENTRTRELAMERFDMVVLNGGLRPTVPGEKTNRGIPMKAGDGFVGAVSGTSRSCGFCKAPADAETSAIQGSAAAIEILTEICR